MKEAPLNLEHLFSPLEIGSVRVVNRVMMPAVTTLMGEPDGTVGDRLTAYCRERARGGTSLIVLEQVAVHPNTRYEFPANGLVGYDPKIIDGYRKLVGALHGEGTKVFCQIFHSGVHNNNVIPDNREINQIWGPSSIPSMAFSRGFEMPKQMGKEDIVEIIERFGKAAEYAVKGGFDGIEIHATTSYLLEQFLSPLYNLRDDEYGGPLKNRIKIILEVVNRVYEETSGRAALGLRIPGDELFPGGLSLEDMQEVATTLEGTGKVEFLDIKAGTFNQGVASTLPSYAEDGWMVKRGIPGGIRRAVKRAKVFAVGKIRHPELAERIIANGEADMVALARTLLADPEWAVKAKEGRVKEIIPCISCNQGCHEHLVKHHIPVTCVLNPATGREREWGAESIGRSQDPKTVVVVGGGPAGMTAARIAAIRGHTVTLFEKERLGGQMNLAARMPGREQFGEAVAWFANQLRLLGVEVHEGVTATPELITSISPQVVITATGARADRTGFSPIRTDISKISGAEQKHVFTPEDLLTSNGYGVDFGDNVVIYDTQGDYLPLAIADLLLPDVKSGRRVTIITHYYYAGFNGEGTTVSALYGRLLGRGDEVVSFVANSIIVAIERSNVAVENKFTRFRSKIAADSIILTTWKHPVSELYYQMKERTVSLSPQISLFNIGDSLSPRQLEQAVFEGYKVAMSI